MSRKMPDSIIIDMEYADYDIIDGAPSAQRHHCFYGSDRQQAHEDGLWVPLSIMHHTEGPESVHHNYIMDVLLHMIAQLAWEKRAVASGMTEAEARGAFRRRYSKSYF